MCIAKVVYVLKNIGKFFFSPKGRLPRIPYAVGAIGVRALTAYVSIIGGRFFANTPEDLLGFFFLLAIMALYVPFLFLLAKRLHDIGWNTWIIWLVVPAFAGWFINAPVLNVGDQMVFLIAIAALFAKGEPKENRYGPVPESWWSPKSAK